MYNSSLHSCREQFGLFETLAHMNPAIALMLACDALDQADASRPTILWKVLLKKLCGRVGWENCVKGVIEKCC